MSETEINQNENQINDTTTEKIILKPKKPRSEKQIENDKKLAELRREKAQKQKEEKEKLLKEEEEKKNKIKEKLTEKIVKKAINLDKKRVSKTKVAKEILTDIESVSSDSEPEKEIEEKPKTKPKKEPILKPKKEVKKEEIKKDDKPLWVYF